MQMGLILQKQQHTIWAISQIGSKSSRKEKNCQDKIQQSRRTLEVLSISTMWCKAWIIDWKLEENWRHKPKCIYTYVCVSVRSMSFYSNFLCGGLILRIFYRRISEVKILQGKVMRITATGIYREKSGMSNSTKKMVWRGKYWDCYGEFYLVGKTTRNLQKQRFQGLFVCKSYMDSELSRSVIYSLKRENIFKYAPKLRSAYTTKLGFRQDSGKTLFTCLGRQRANC